MNPPHDNERCDVCDQAPPAIVWFPATDDVQNSDLYVCRPCKAVLDTGTAAGIFRESLLAR